MSKIVQVVGEYLDDYAYSVEKDETGTVRCFRKLINASPDTARKERIAAVALPSEALKAAFAMLAERSRAELQI